MDLRDLAQVIHERSRAQGGVGFADEFSGVYGISPSESGRLSAEASDIDDFERMWRDEDWWTDGNNPRPMR